MEYVQSHAHAAGTVIGNSDGGRGNKGAVDKSLDDFVRFTVDGDSCLQEIFGTEEGEHAEGVYGYCADFRDGRRRCR